MKKVHPGPSGPWETTQVVFPWRGCSRSTTYSYHGPVLTRWDRIKMWLELAAKWPRPLRRTRTCWQQLAGRTLRRGQHR